MGFVTKEGTVGICAIATIIAAKYTDIIPSEFRYVAAIVSIMYIMWYFYFCYKEAMKSRPDIFLDAMMKANGGNK